MVEARCASNIPYAPEDQTRRGYITVPGGVVVPKRLDDGVSPAFDPKKGASQFTVNIIDGDEIRTYLPGETDAMGNPIEKETACPSPSTPIVPGTPENSKGRYTRRRKQPSPLEQTSQLQLLLDDVNSLRSELNSLMKSPPQSTQKSPGPTITPERIELSGSWGTMAFEALSVGLEDPELITVVVDPQKPYFAPASKDPMALVYKGVTWDVVSGGLKIPLKLGELSVVVLLFVVVASPQKAQ